MSVVGRSPFEYLLNAPAGGGVASAFQEGEAAASRQATEASMRAESALRQQKAGLDIGEFQANAPLREAERQRMLGQYQFGDQLEREGIGITSAGGAGAAAGAATPARMPGAAGFIAGFEGFRAAPYYDVNTYRVGFGSDTITRPDGTVVRVAPGMTVTAEDAQRDLERRINTEFTPRAQRAVGADTWSSLPAPVQEALVSVAYNYGSLPQRLVTAAKTGNPEQIAGAIEALAGDNQGVNRQRRFAEAAHVRSALAAPAAAPQGAATPAPLMSFAPGLSPATPQPRMPSMLSAPNAGMSIGYSPAGVPITEPDANLPDPRASNTEAVFNVPMYNAPPQQVTVSGTQPAAAPAPAAPAPVPTTGLPAERAAAARAAEEANRLREIAARETTRQTAVFQSPEGQAAVRLMEEGRIRNDRAMYMRGRAELIRLTEAMYARMDAGQPEPAFTATPAPAAAPAAAPAPSPFFTTTPEAIAQAPVTTNLAALGITPVGRAPVGAPAAPAAAGGGAAAQPVGLGLEYSVPAQRLQQQIAREKELLRREFASIRALPPGEAQRAEAARLRRAYAALEDKEIDVRADLAAGGILAGQTGLANQLLASNGIFAQPRVTNGRFTGYDLVRNGSVVQSNVSPEKLAEVVRNSYNADARRQMQERAKAQFDAMLEVFKDRAKQLGVATTEIAKIEAQARTRGFSQATKIGEEELILTNPTTMEALRYSFVPVPGSRPPRKELVVEQVRANVPVQ